MPKDFKFFKSSKLRTHINTPYDRTQFAIIEEESEDDMATQETNNTAANGIDNLNLNLKNNLPSTSNNTTHNSNSDFQNINDVFNQLKIPDAIKDLPYFDGNTRLLYEFINNVEETLYTITSINGTNYARTILRAIQNKIVGQANEILNMYGTPLDWKEIRVNLILHYSDKRNETSLIRDLHDLRQINDTVEQYYSKIIEILSTMTNHVNIHETNENVISAKHKLYAEMCLNTFLIGLKEPLGSTIRAMRPSTLAEALNFCIREQNTYYMRNNTQKILPKPGIQKRPYHPPASYQPPSRYSPPQQQLSRYHNTNQYSIRPPIPNQRAIQPSTSYQQRNNFGLNVPNTHISRQTQYPVPMDTSSGYSQTQRSTPGQPQFNKKSTFNQITSPNFAFKELHNITNANCEQQLDQYVLTQPYDEPEEISQNLTEMSNTIDDSNFPLTASESNMDS